MEAPITTAILSYGMSGEVFHAPLIAALPGYKLSVIVQRKTGKAGEHYPNVQIVKSLEDVLGNDAIELVVINTPNETHFAYATAAIKAGKHVVVEKPFTVTSEEGEKLVKLAKDHNKLLAVFQNRRWDGDFLTVRDLVQSKRLGKIVEFEAHYDRFRNYIEPNTWKEEKRPGTGIVYNLGSHMLDQALVLFGLPDYVDARIGVQRPGGEVDDYYDIRMEYAGHLAIIKSSYLVKENLPRYIIHGTDGSFVKYGLDPHEQALKEKQDYNQSGWGKEDPGNWGTLNTIGEGIKRIETMPGDYAAFYRNLFDAIRNKGTLAVRPEEALDVIRMIEYCYESSAAKAAVKIKK